MVQVAERNVLRSTEPWRKQRLEDEAKEKETGKSSGDDDAFCPVSAAVRSGVCRAGRLWLRGAQRGPRLRQRGRHELASLRPKALGEKELEGENPAMFGGNVERCVY